MFKIVHLNFRPFTKTYDKSMHSVTAETYTYITSETSPISMKCIDARVYLLYPVSPICPAKFPNMLQNGSLSGASVCQSFDSFIKFAHSLFKIQTNFRTYRREEAG